MAFDIQFKLIYQGIRDVFRVRSLSNYLYNLDRQSLFAKQPENEPYDKQVKLLNSLGINETKMVYKYDVKENTIILRPGTYVDEDLKLRTRKTSRMP